MIVQFSIFPMDSAHVSRDLRRALAKLDELGIEHEVGPMGTCIRAPWDEAMRAIRECHKAMAVGHERIVTQITIDDHGASEHTLRSAVEAVEHGGSRSAGEADEQPRALARREDRGTGADDREVAAEQRADGEDFALDPLLEPGEA